MRWTCPVTPLNAGKGAPLISPQGSRPPGFESLWTAALAPPDWPEPALRQGKLLPSLLGVLGTFDLPNVARALSQSPVTVSLPTAVWRATIGTRAAGTREKLARERQQVPRWPKPKDPRIRRICSAVAHSKRLAARAAEPRRPPDATIRSQLHPPAPIRQTTTQNISPTHATAHLTVSTHAV